jgi:predicted AAA+ superfamily ATPase
LIKRQRYLDQLISLKGKKLIKVITGVRRCGKSSLLELYKNHLLDNGVAKEQIIDINFEDLQFENLLDYKMLYDHIMKKKTKGKMTYIMLDEIQNVSQFEKTVDSLYIQENVDITITGSNAYMLSGELASLLSGRYIEIEMYPLSFKEYVSYVDTMSETSRKSLDDKFNDYLKYGGLPYILDLENDDRMIRNYLSGIYNTVLLKDIVKKQQVKDVALLESIATFIFENIGKIVSPKKISDTLRSYNRRTTQVTVENYISWLQRAFVIYKVSRYDIKGKAYLKTLEKYYSVDIGLRNNLLGYKEHDIGCILENIVFLELKRRGYQVYIGKYNDLEVDFIAVDSNDKKYYQVTAGITASEDTKKREFRPLESIRDNYEKYLITMDKVFLGDHNGIKVINIIEFLME